MNIFQKYFRIAHRCLLPLWTYTVFFAATLYGSYAPAQAICSNGSHYSAAERAAGALRNGQTDNQQALHPSFSGGDDHGAINTLSLSGLVWNDVNGNLSLDPRETACAGLALFVNLVDTTGHVVNSSPVGADGRYAMKVPAHINSYKLVLATGAAAATPGLPGSGWVNTGESGNGSNQASQLSSPVGEIDLSTAAENITGQNFGIERRPSTRPVASIRYVNPGGALHVPAPALGGTDPDDDADRSIGGIHTIRIQTLPANGVLYYRDKEVWAGQTIAHYNPAWLTVDPGEGEQTLRFTFSVVDDAEQESLPGVVEMNFYTKAPPAATSAYAEGCRGVPTDMIRIYPNPVIDKVHLIWSSPARVKEIRMLDTEGRVVYRSGAVDSIDMKERIPGIYLLELELPDQTIACFKLLKQ